MESAANTEASKIQQDLRSDEQLAVVLMSILRTPTKLDFGMLRKSHKSSAHAIPCALSDYLRSRPHHKTDTRVMEYECRHAFLNWVAYRESLPYEERLFCPMSGCHRNDFNDTGSWLQHVRKCLFLPCAQYWCPYHGRYENYMEIENHISTPSKDYKPVNESKLKHNVVLFFKKFGLRRTRNSLSPHELPSEAPYPTRKSELEGLGPTEVGQKMYAKELRLPEMEDPDSSLYNSHGPKISVPELDVRRSCVPRLELPAWNLQWELWGDSIIASGLELSGTRFSNATGSDIDQMELDLPGNVQQISVTPSIPRRSEDVAHTSPHSALHSPEPLDFYSKSESSCSQRPSETNSDPLHHKSGLARQGAAYPTVRRSSSLAPTQHLIPRKPVANANCHSLSYPSLNSDEPLQAFSSTNPDEGPVTRIAVGSHIQSLFEGRFVLDSPKPLEDLVSSNQNTSTSSFSGNRRVAPPGHLDSVAWNRETKDGSNSSKSHHGPVDLRIHIPLPSSGRHNMGHRKQDIVKNLCSIVEILAGLWAKRLDSCPALYHSPPLQTGLNVLKRFLSLDQSLPTTTIEIFHFVHIAFACAYMIHSEEGCYPWELFYQNLLLWGRGITDPQDRALYLAVAEYLWFAEPGTMFTPVSKYWSEKSNIHIPKPNAASEFLAQTLHSQTTVVELEDKNKGDQEIQLLGQLKKGIVMNSCTRYLDELFRADLVQRNMYRLEKVILPQGSLLGATQIFETIMKPLLQDDSFQPFHIHVTTTLTMLQEGLLSNIREVEVDLITRSYGTPASPERSQAFIDLVKELCDGVFPNAANWRDPFYATLIDYVRAKSEQAISHVSLEDHGGPTGEKNTLVQPRGAMGPGNDTPSSAATSGSSFNCGGGSATSATPSSASTLLSSPADSVTAGREKQAVGAFSGNMGLRLINTAHVPSKNGALHSYNSPGRDQTSLDESQPSTECAIASPMTGIDSSPASRNILTPSLTDDNRAYCPLCPTSFGGTRQDRESNCRRHLKHVHHKGHILYCTECSWKCGRTDSLRKHRRSVHGIDDPCVRSSSSSMRQRKSVGRKARTSSSAKGAVLDENCSLW